MKIDIDPVTKSMRFKMRSFVPQINSMNIQLHGGASWFYNIFMSLFQNVIIGMMQDQLGGQVPPMIEAILQQEITNLYTPFAPVADTGLMTDYQFVSIDVTPAYIGFGVPTTGSYISFCFLFAFIFKKRLKILFEQFSNQTQHNQSIQELPNQICQCLMKNSRTKCIKLH